MEAADDYGARWTVPEDVRFLLELEPHVRHYEVLSNPTYPKRSTPKRNRPLLLAAPVAAYQR